MPIKNVSFIEIRSPGAHVFSKFPIPRLGSVLLSTILRNAGINVKVFIEDVAEPDWLFVENSDVVCISTITSTAIRAYEVADRLRRLGVPVVIGGAHPSLMPDEAIGHADYVVRGEGDHTLPELIRYLSGGAPPLDAVRGITYRDASGSVVHNPARPLLEDMDALPSPDFSLIYGWKPSNTYPISTSRGCPFSCRFCSVIQVFGGKYRFRSVGVALDEIRRVASAYKATIFFVDDNFTANRKRAKAILRGMIDEGIRHNWSAQVRTDVARDPELLRLMADSGCHTLYIGFESINPATLALYEKRQSPGEIADCIRTVKGHGITIHGMFVLGADSDDVATIGNTADFAIRLGLDTIQFMPLTPLPGTPFFFEMKEAGRLLHTDWSKYDMHHVVFSPAAMRPETLQVETLRAMKKFYSWKYIVGRLARLDFHYALIGLYGNRTVKRLLGGAREYFENIGQASCNPLNV